MASYKCDTCGEVRDFPSGYPTIYCQGFAPNGDPCDGICKRQVSA